jgi:hypothetical protein
VFITYLLQNSPKRFEYTYCSVHINFEKTRKTCLLWRYSVLPSCSSQCHWLYQVATFLSQCQLRKQKNVCWSQDGGIRGKILSFDVRIILETPQLIPRNDGVYHAKNTAETSDKFFSYPSLWQLWTSLITCSHLVRLPSMLSVNQWSPVCRLCTLSNSAMEVVFGWPLWGSTSTSCLSSWKLLNYHNVCAWNSLIPLTKGYNLGQSHNK